MQSMHSFDLTEMVQVCFVFSLTMGLFSPLWHQLRNLDAVKPRLPETRAGRVYAVRASLQNARTHAIMFWGRDADCTQVSHVPCSLAPSRRSPAVLCGLAEE